MTEIIKAIDEAKRLTESIPETVKYIGERTLTISGREGLGLHVPKQVAHELGLSQGDRISLWISNEYLVIKKCQSLD